MFSQEQALIRFIQRRLLKGGKRAVTPTTQIFEERLVDSMNILYLIGYVEHAIGRRLTNDELVMANFRSARAIVRAFLS